MKAKQESMEQDFKTDDKELIEQKLKYKYAMQAKRGGNEHGAAEQKAQAEKL
jgi:hypothetical protein